jgi:hypothetical protein
MAETGDIYFIQQENALYKIGFSKDVPKRLRELKIGNPDNLRIQYIIHDATIPLEHHIQEVCKAFVVEGEWFQEAVINFLLEKSSPWFRENMIKVKAPKRER